MICAGGGLLGATSMVAQMTRVTRRLIAGVIFVITAPLVCSASEGELQERPALRAGEGTTPGPVVLPGTGFVVEPGAPVVTGSGHSPTALLQAIAAWLSSEFGLPPVRELPAVNLASKRQMLSLRHRAMSPSPGAGYTASRIPIETAEDILAIYDTGARTIYLPERWSGKTPADLSMLVHEMVHHLQHVGGLKFACPEEREKMAFKAQERWLQLFGSSLEADFELDPFTILARTNCFH